jgi:hypothetical protein
MADDQQEIFDLEFWPEDELAAKFNYVRIPDAISPVDEEVEVLARMQRQVNDSKRNLDQLRDEKLAEEGKECTFSPAAHGSPRRDLRSFLSDQRHFIKEKELHLQKLRRDHRDRTKEVWPYTPTINPNSAKLAHKQLQKPLVQRLAKPPLKVRHYIPTTPKAELSKTASKTNLILGAQLKKEVKAAWRAEGCCEYLDFCQLSRLLVELKFVKSHDSSLLRQVWGKLSSKGQISLDALVSFLMKESRLSSQKPVFDSLYYNRSLSASRSRTRTDTETSAATSCDIRPFSRLN